LITAALVSEINLIVAAAQACNCLCSSLLWQQLARVLWRRRASCQQGSDYSLKNKFISFPLSAAARPSFVNPTTCYIIIIITSTAAASLNFSLQIINVASPEIFNSASNNELLCDDNLL